MPGFWERFKSWIGLRLSAGEMKAKTVSKAEMSHRVYRAKTGRWEEPKQDRVVVTGNKEDTDDEV